jgi:ABC-type glycerol-3-phosphate transport system permease component
MIDGCSRAGAFWRVTFPLLAPGLIATGVFGFIQAWNEFIMALVLNARPEMMTLPVWLRTYLVRTARRTGRRSWRARPLWPSRSSCSSSSCRGG